MVFESIADTSPLPPNPDQWVCPDSLIGPSKAEIQQWCDDNPDRGQPAPLILQSPPPLHDLTAKNLYDEEYGNFTRGREYATELGWKHDLNWRLTGPYVGPIGSGSSYGSHPAVKIYYSPEVVDWLCSDRQGEIPDGAMIVKEQHNIDSNLGITLNSQNCMVIQNDVSPSSWSTLIKSKESSKDGWYWGSVSTTPVPPVSAWQVGNPPVFDRSGITSDDFYAGNPNPPVQPNPDWYPTGYLFASHTKIPNIASPYSIYGNYCINCHASAVSESTFSSIANIITPGIQYKQFMTDQVMLAVKDQENFKPLNHQPPIISLLHPLTPDPDAYESPFTQPLTKPTQQFLDFYDQLNEVSFTEAWKERLPAETYDHIVSAMGGPGQFLTSDQCQGCHDTSFMNSSLPNMLFQETTEDGSTQLINLSPYGEWTASPMGMAGRDPIFFSQLQSETNNLPELTTCIETTCLHCHGVMGQRQLAIDTPASDDPGCKDLFTIPPPEQVPFGKPFRKEMVTQWPGSEFNVDQRYGALARDGISCTVCHHISNEALDTPNSYTGNFVTGPADVIYGPFQDVVPKPMQHSLGITPQYGEQITQWQVCGTCHNILLPVFNNEGTQVSSSYEQTTHLEWTNSVYGPNRSEFQSCQGCHMQTHYKGQDLTFKIANIESSDSAPTTDRLPNPDIKLKPRNPYSRHQLHGLNVFINQMFQQFPLILGDRQIDFMTGSGVVPPLITGFNSMLEMAENETAAVNVESLEKTADGKLKAKVNVTSKVGHYLPSGVGFRRVFLEFKVMDKDGNLLWASGRTNELGAIVDGTTDKVLPSEQPVKFPNAPFQPHYQVITSGDQVQIYQEMIKDSDGQLTTSFLRRVDKVKDNRIRPKGFDPAFFALNPSPFVQELAEIPGQAKFDPHYTDPNLTGSDNIEYLVTLNKDTLERVGSVTATLYNQSIPPFYLQQRFRDANRGPKLKNEIDRLFYLTSHLNVDTVAGSDKPSALKSWKLALATHSRKYFGKEEVLDIRDQLLGALESQ